MFFTESEKRTYAVKPMNCPGHVQVFKQGLHSYRDLPIRYGEFGSCHRNEPSGALHGILRVRGFTQDDGHIFCTEDQIESEVTAFHQQALAVYESSASRTSRSRSRCARNRASATTRPGTRPKARCARRCRLWRGMAGAAGRGRVLRPEDRIPPEGRHRPHLAAGHHAGRLHDAGPPRRRIRRREQPRAPVMLHRAIVGSMERFIGILIEHHAGQFPAWLAPVQVVVMNITDAQADYVSGVAKPLSSKASASGGFA
jgi:threonyl-tRNA synthetase